MASRKGDYLPLHVAATIGNETICKLLIAKGASLNGAASSGYTPLHYAVWHGHNGIAELLLTNGANPMGMGKRDRSGDRPEVDWSPLQLAVKRGNTAIAKVLIRQGGVNVVTQDGIGSLTPLHMAVLEDLESFVSMMVEPFDVLYEAAFSFSSEAVEKPIYMAASLGRMTIFKLLAKKTVISPERAQFLANGALAYGHEEIAEWLVEEKLTEGNERRKGVWKPSNWYPLHQAVWEGDIDQAKQLIEERGDRLLWRRCWRNGWTALHLAARMNSIDVARVLAEKGGEKLIATRSWGKRNDTAMHLACGYGSVELVQLLYSIGGKRAVFRKNFNSTNCIERAAHWYRYDVMKWLLHECGLDASSLPRDMSYPPLLQWFFLDTLYSGLSLWGMLEEELGPRVASQELLVGK